LSIFDEAQTISKNRGFFNRISMDSVEEQGVFQQGAFAATLFKIASDVISVREDNRRARETGTRSYPTVRPNAAAKLF
jgi:hypothetical protein